MKFLAPLGFFFALFLPAIVLLYLLKLKRIDTPISSTLLWRKSLEDLKANTPFQKLKRNLLLFLQLAVVALLTLAVARPVLQLGGLKGQSFIVLIDRSASMSAVDAPPSRLEQAKRKAAELVNDMSLGDRMMLVTFDAGAQVLSTFEDDKGALRSLVQGITPTENPTRITEALNIARSAAEVQPNPEVVIFSDGQFQIPDDFPLGSLKIRFLPIGQSAENVGIVDLSVRRDFSLRQNYQVMAGIQNCGDAEKSVYVELWGEGNIHSEVSSPTQPVSSDAEGDAKAARTLLDARRLTLAAGAKETVLFSDPGVFPEKIEVNLDSDDPFPADNHAWAMIPKDESIKVLLVSGGNYFLQRVLNLDPRVRLTTGPAANYAGPEDYDLVIFDSFAPPALVDGRYVFIKSIPPLPDWSMGEVVKLPAIVDWKRFHPLTRYLTLENLTINKCNNLGVPAWAEIIAESRETPLLVAFRQESIQGLVIAFDLYDSDWPLRVSYPIFFSNLIDWFQNESGASSLIKRTGDILTLDPPVPFAEKARLNGPQPNQQRVISFSGPTPDYFGETDHIGIYEYIAGKIHRNYAVNLLSARESTIRPQNTLKSGEMEIHGDSGVLETNREAWRALALLALLALGIEWFVYVKRAKYAL